VVKLTIGEEANASKALTATVWAVAWDGLTLLACRLGPNSASPSHAWNPAFLADRYSAFLPHPAPLHSVRPGVERPDRARAIAAERCNGRGPTNGNNGIELPANIHIIYVIIVRYGAYSCQTASGQY
jgi:hypothetical protein